MTTKRRDVWKQDEDQLLVDTILRFIRKKKTQIEAFEVVSKKLGRTSAACGFRWNSVLRKKYSEKIKQAKAVSEKPIIEEKTSDEPAVPYEQAREFLDSMYERLKSFDKNTNIKLKQKNADLKSELEKVKIRNKQLIKDLEQFKEENNRLNAIVEYVRSVVV